MEWLELLLGALGGGGICSIFLIKETRKAKRIENERNASQVWRELYEKSEQRCDTLSSKIDQLYKENSKFRDENNELTTQNAVLSIQKCVVNGCKERVPPREF